MTGAPPLVGLTVRDDAGGVAGRYCARLFAQFGAKVVRDRIDDDAALGHGGEAGHLFGRWLDKDKVQDLFLGESVSLLIRDEEGSQSADPEARLTLDFRWFGSCGPYAGWSGNDPTLQALVGLAYSFGPAEGPPVLAQGHGPQMAAGVTGFIASLAGLITQHRGGNAGQIEVANFEAAACFSEPNAVSYAHFGHQARRLGYNRFVPTYPCSIYRARSGWIGVTALTPLQWHALCELIGLPSLAHDPRFATTLDRLAHADLIDSLIGPAFLLRDAVELAEAGQAARVPMVPVTDLEELAQLPHWAGRNTFAAELSGRPIVNPAAPFTMAWNGHRRALPRLEDDDGPLAGLRVVDFSMGWAGPLTTRTLADLGAEVIKIESEARPDWWRGWEKPAPGVTVEEAPVFCVMNRGKRGVSLDLKTEDGLLAVQNLIRGADVVVENFAPGVMDRLGLGYEELRRMQPALIHIAMGAFGQHGRWSGFRAYGSTVEQASGLPLVNGFEDGPPALQHIAYGDPVAGLFGAAAALIGLLGRGRLGGCAVDLSQVETLFQFAAEAIIARQADRRPLPRTGSRRPTMTPCGCFPTSEPDEWLAIACGSKEQWRALCGVTGRVEWLSDPRMADRTGRYEVADKIEHELAAWSATRRAGEAVRLLQGSGIPAAPVQPLERLVDDPQLLEAGYWVEFERPHIGRHRAGAAPFTIDGHRPCAKSPAPTLGEHQLEIVGKGKGP